MERYGNYWYDPGVMRWLTAVILSWSFLEGNIADIREWDQTFFNETLLGQSLIFKIMRDNLDAIKCVEGHKIYLKADHLFPSEKGMMLIGDDSSSILLPKLYSDKFGCYIKSSMLCASCRNELPNEMNSCFQLRNE